MWIVIRQHRGKLIHILGSKWWCWDSSSVYSPIKFKVRLQNPRINIEFVDLSLPPKKETHRGFIQTKIYTQKYTLFFKSIFYAQEKTYITAPHEAKQQAQAERKISVLIQI